MRLQNPILTRELIEHLRSPRAFFLQGIFVLLLGTVVLVAWPPMIELRMITRTSVEIYETFARGILILLMLLAPILSAPAISSERERRSMDLLLTSPLSVRSIVLGKLFSALAYLLLVGYSGLPIVSSCLRLGGIDHRNLLASFIMIASATFFCGSVSLTASVYMGRSRAALSVSYLVVLPLCMILGLSPGIMTERNAAVYTSVFLVSVSVCLLWKVIRRLKEPFDTAPKAADDEDRDEQVGLTLDRQRFPDNLLTARNDGRPMDETGNTVYAKELRHELFGRGTLLVRLLLQISLVAALPFFIVSLRHGQWVYSAYVLLFLMLLAPSITAGIFTQERERGTLDLLLTTTLTRNQILWGKLAVNLRIVGILLGFLTPLILLNWAIQHMRGQDAADIITPFVRNGGTLLICFATALLLVSITSFFSLICRTTLRSMVFSYITIGAFFAIPLLLFRVLTRFAQVPKETAHWYALTSPFFAVANFEAPALVRHGILLPGATAHLHLGFYLAFTTVLSLLCLTAIYLLYPRYMQYRHDRGL